MELRGWGLRQRGDFGTSRWGGSKVRLHQPRHWPEGRHRLWHLASIRGNAALRSLSWRSGSGRTCGAGCLGRRILNDLPATLWQAEGAATWLRELLVVTP